MRFEFRYLCQVVWAQIMPFFKGAGVNMTDISAMVYNNECAGYGES